MSYTSEKIYEFCQKNNIECLKDDAEKFDVLYKMLIEFNSHTNVTALKTESDICSRHFIDSVYPIKYNLIPDSAKVIDIGCGAGFPGIPLKMIKKDIDISFIDSTEKKLRFTKSVSDFFSLNAKLYPARAEELVADGHREKYDAAVSRAVASLPVLCELCLPYVRPGGIFIAYKSMKESNLSNPESELNKAKKAISVLSAQLVNVFPAPIEESDGTISEHALIVIKKIAKTPIQYPRRYSVILKKTL